MLEDLKPKGPARPCRARNLLHSLSDSDQRILKDAIDSPDWTIHGLVTALNERGLDISWTSINRHKLRRCSCGEAEYA